MESNIPFSMLQCMKYTDRDMIQQILATYYILDYGFITKVNADKTINVTHAARLRTLLGKSLEDTVTKNLEVLTVSCGGFALSVDYKEGDKVLLLGLKNYVQNCGDVNKAEDQKTPLHYSRDTLKAMPLCVFDDNAKVTIEVKDGSMKVQTQDKLELNGNDKQFVTWSELNQALQNLITSLNSHTHTVSGLCSTGPISGTAAPVVSPFQLDISNAKTTTVVTGG